MVTNTDKGQVNEGGTLDNKGVSSFLLHENQEGLPEGCKRLADGNIWAVSIIGNPDNPDEQIMVSAQDFRKEFTYGDYIRLSQPR